MSTKTTRSLRSVIAAAAAAVGGLGTIGLVGANATAAHAAPSSYGVIGHVYVNDNNAGSETISGFDRHANGSLTPIPGSPFATGGLGLGAGTASQGSLQETADGRYLLAVDAGSNQISVLRIASDGALRPVAGGPVGSGGVQPVSIGVDPAVARDGRELVYVANSGSGGSDYTGFTLRRDGQLTALAGSTVALPDGSTPGDVLFNANGTHLAATRVGTALVDSFDVGRNGLLTAAPGSPFPSQGPGPIGAEFSPTAPSHLFVSNAHGGANNGTVSAFSDAADGILTSIGTGPFADDQTAPCWVAISPDGRYLFAVNTAVPSISRYSIAHDGSLTLLGSTPLSTPTESTPTDARLTPDGRTLYVVDSGGLTVSAFAVHQGNLTELPSSPTPLPAGTAPVGIVVN
jgi:6-phosphogluconolactonase (cycloisomerase 2 family)